ncbi:MAG: hypothetical protein JRJ86_14060 [Deltaproteobacteria bacterium]|nr:hypothetical protein [Deltaproteobacteria bacterium]MBW2119733.1 hypothetical protein [Deltaproteobacteria bacterium]
MDPNIGKNIAQLFVFGGALIVIIGQVGVWYYDKNITKIEKAKIISMREERDQAIDALQRLSLDNISRTKFSAVLDNKIKHIYFEMEFSKSTMNRDFRDFYCFMMCGALDVCYEIIPAPPNSLGMGHKVTAYTANYSNAFGTDSKEWEAWDLLPSDHPNSLRSEIFLLLGEKRRKCTIRSFQDSHFKIAVKEKFVPFISGIRLIVNDWEIYDRKPKIRDWVYWPVENRMRQKNIGKIYGLRNANPGSKRAFILLTFPNISPKE